jgi:hypothetical protein
MTPLVLIAAILAAPVLLLNILRVNAMMVFLSLCLGVVLVRFVSDDAASTVGILALGTGHSNQALISLCLLFAPAVLTTVFMIGTVRNKLKQLLNFFLSIAVASLVVLLAEPYLSPALHATLVATPIWDYLQKLQTLVVTIGGLITLLLLWMQRTKQHAEEGKKHRG